MLWCLTPLSTIFQLEFYHDDTGGLIMINKNEKQKKYHIVRTTVPNSNIKIAERGKLDTPNT